MKRTIYDGTFELAFLRNNERVRSAGDGSGAIVIESSDYVFRIEKDSAVIRNDDGSISTEIHVHEKVCPHCGCKHQWRELPGTPRVECSKCGAIE